MDPDDGGPVSAGLTTWRSAPGRRAAETVVAAANRLHGSIDKSTVPYVVLAVTTAIGLTGAALLTVASAEIYDAVTEGDGIAGFDRPVLNQMIAWRTPGRDAWITRFTDLGSPTVMPFIAALAAGLLAWWWRRWTPALLLLIAITGSLTMTVVGKSVIARSRPDRSLAVPPFETTPSFPSGHTLNSWVIFAMIAYLVVCRVTSAAARVAAVVLAVALSVAMGLSRVYLGHHWLTDVAVAWTLGTAWLFVVITGHRLALTVSRRQAPHRRRQAPMPDG